MKYRIFFVVILLPLFCTAQVKAPAKMDTLAAIEVLNAAMNSTLGIDSTSDETDMNAYTEFKNLFDSSAMVVDNFNIYYRLGKRKAAGQYIRNAAPKPFDLFAHDVALQVKNIFINDSFTITGSSYKNPKAIVFTGYRKVMVQKTRQYVLGSFQSYADSLAANRSIQFDSREDKADMMHTLSTILEESSNAVYRFAFIEHLDVSIRFDEDRNTYKITSIANTAIDSINALNDKDGDAILDAEDSSSEAGDFTAHGFPDYDLDGIANGPDRCPNTYGSKNNFGCPASYFVTSKQFNGFVGLQVNTAKINLPALNEYGYVDRNNANAMDVLQSKNGVIQNPERSLGVYAGANMAYFFGKKRKNGISVGIVYSRFSAAYQLKEPAVYTYKAFDGTDDYRRQVTIQSMKEDIAYNVFNFPLLYNFRWHLGKVSNAGNGKGKTIMTIKAGPSFLLFSNTSDYNAVIDFGGIYQVDPNLPGANKITYNDFFDPASSYNVYVTSKGINEQNSSSGAVDVFQQLSKNYDFASNKIYRDKKKNLTHQAIGINAAVDLEKEITYKFIVKAGVHFLYTRFTENKSKYIFIDKTTDEYNSIFNSSAKRNYSAFGINIGFAYNF